MNFFRAIYEQNKLNERKKKYTCRVEIITNNDKIVKKLINATKKVKE